MNRKKQFIKLSGTLTILALCLVSAEGSNAKIAFTSDRDENREIYIMSDDGSALERLTTNDLDDVVTDVSPDGTRILFEYPQDDIEQIWVMNSDGMGREQLTDPPSQNLMGRFSPDASKIVFATGRDGNAEIYLMNADGTDQINLTNHDGEDLVPAFSPDGTKIAWVSRRTGNWDIWIMNSDGTEQRNLTNNSAFDDGPCFSPDGSRIAFQSNRDGDYEIYTMNVDGSDVEQLTFNAAYDCCPVFRADGSRIAFHSNNHVEGNNEIYSMNVEGKGVKRLTFNASSHSWGPHYGPLITPVAPASFAVTHGRHLSGGLPDLFDSDDNYLLVQAMPAISLLSPSIQVEVEGTAPQGRVVYVKFRFEAGCSAFPSNRISQRLYLYNYEADLWELMYQDAPTFADSVVEVLITSNPGRFVEPGTKKMKARMAWFDLGGLVAVNWFAAIDEAVWEIGSR